MTNLMNMCLLEKIYESIRKGTPAAFIICGDFIARSPLFWEGDFKNNEGRLFNNFLISNHLEQLINEPTYVHDDGSQSCIDLICTDQPFMFMETGVLSSLDPCSKHNIVHGTINISVPRPPRYKRKLWDDKSAYTDIIRADLLKLNWRDLFCNLNIHEQGLVFTDTFMNIVDKQISNKIIICNDKDAPWVTPKGKTAIKRNSRVYRKCVKRGRNTNDLDNVRELHNSTNKFIKEAKLAYYIYLGIKLSDPESGQKHFWTAYKRIANKKRNTNIPPIIDEDIFISNFKKKADLFNDYFANQCIINDNGSVLSSLVPKTAASFSHVSVTKEQIINIINNLSSNKAHGYDGISVSMLKLCAAEVASPLQIIFQDCINFGIFPDCWKYASVQPIHKKNKRQIISNYRPISLLPICSKIIEKIVLDQVYAVLNTNNVLSANQSGFRPGDSTIYQLLSITSTIYDSFENYDETRAIFLDISQAFDKVWHDAA